MPIVIDRPDALVIQRPKLAWPFIAAFILWLLVLPLLLWRPTGAAFYVSALLLGALEAVALFSLGGVRILATAQSLEMRSLFWRLWHVELDHMTIREGKVGEDIRFDAYIVRDRRHRCGAIVRKEFEPESLQRLFAFLVAHGATVVEPARLKGEDAH